MEPNLFGAARAVFSEILCFSKEELDYPPLDELHSGSSHSPLLGSSTWGSPPSLLHVFVKDQVSFVNSINTSRGGTHVSYITDQAEPSSARLVFGMRIGSSFRGSTCHDHDYWREETHVIHFNTDYLLRLVVASPVTTYS